MQILVAHPSPAVRDLLTSRLYEAFADGDLIIDSVGNEAEALGKIHNQQHDPYSVLITSADLPNSPTAILDQAQRGLKIVQSLCSDPICPTKCLVITPVQGHGVSFQLQGVSYIPEGVEMFEDVVLAAKVALNQAKLRPRLSVIFSQERDANVWTVRLNGGPNVQPHDRFQVDPLLFRFLATRSARLAEDEATWLDELADIGHLLYGSLIEHNDTFKTQFWNAVHTAGGIPRVRFSFDVHPQIHSLALEALLKTEQATEAPEQLQFWMLQAPICRTLSLQESVAGSEDRTPLFQSASGPINCLVVSADAAGDVEIPGRADKLPLPQFLDVREECDSLTRQLKEHSQAWGIGEVLEITARDASRAGTSFRQYLEKVLRSRQWHLVHYSGHSYYARPSRPGGLGTGYLFLPGNDAGTIERLDAGLFASWLQHTQLLFLSSCESSEENFVFEMARNKIPAVLGFRWRVKEHWTADYAANFYQTLFQQRSIESAFVSARQHVREIHGARTQIWAAPMLVFAASQRAMAAA